MHAWAPVWVHFTGTWWWTRLHVLDKRLPLGSTTEQPVDSQYRKREGLLLTTTAGVIRTSGKVFSQKDSRFCGLT